MVIHFDPSGFFESTGNAAARFGEQLRDAIITHSCNIWTSFPTFVTGGRDPISSYARGFMNGVCEAAGTSAPSIEPGVTGGQCPEVEYRVTIEYTSGAGGPVRDRGVNVFGPVSGASFQIGGATPRYEIGVTAAEAPPGTNQIFYMVDAYSLTLGPPDYVIILDIVRLDGQPDNCGNKPPEYPPETPPTQQDLSTTINITNIDGVDNEYSLTWNNTNNLFNFPFHFKLNGTNVVVDVGGVTIYGDPNVTSPNTGNESLPPGSDGGKDVDGNDYEEVFPDTEFPALPDLVTPELVEVVLEYFLCELGVIEIIEGIVKLPPGYSAIWQLIITVLKNIVQEICEDDTGEIGFPEIYPVLPGVDRPIIMYYYKQFIDGEKQPSTYISTLPNPNASAIAEIETVIVPDRVLGTNVASIKLLDGSRIVARGDTEAEALDQFNFLISRTLSSNVPADVSTNTVITRQERLQVVSVSCTQIEYYPDGKSFGRTASIRRVIDVSP